MTRGEQFQQRTDDAWLAYEERQNLRRFESHPLEPLPAPAAPSRYRFFKSARDAYADPVVGPLMREEDEREREGLPPTFSIL